MKSYKMLATILLFSVLLNSCKEKPSNQVPTETKKVIDADLKVGGLYVTQGKDNMYSISKILAIDNFAVHTRMYTASFKNKPIDISSDSLKFLIGHAPISKEGFLASNPELLKVETVKDTELEGYKIYLEEMSK